MAKLPEEQAFATLYYGYMSQCKDINESMIEITLECLKKHCGRKIESPSSLAIESTIYYIKKANVNVYCHANRFKLVHNHVKYFLECVVQQKDNPTQTSTTPSAIEEINKWPYILTFCTLPLSVFVYKKLCT